MPKDNLKDIESSKDKIEDEIIVSEVDGEVLPAIQDEPDITQGSVASFGKGSNELFQYIKKISQFPMLEEREEEELLREYQDNNNQEAGKRIVASHLRLVVKVAYRYRRYTANIMDLISEGNLGLMHALRKFKPSKDVRFSTYSRYWVIAYMQNFIIRTYSSLKTNYSELKDALFGKFTGDRGDILAKKEVSFDSSGSESEEYSAQDYYSYLSRGNEGTEADLFIEESDRELKIALIEKAAITVLNEREREIFKARVCEEQQTLQELSEHFGISKERVRQIESSATQKIRKFIEENE